MSGRFEQNAVYETKIEKLLCSLPLIFRDYIENEKRVKTCSTRYMYLCYLKKFYIYLCEKNKEITEVRPLDISGYRNKMSVSEGKLISSGYVNVQLAAIADFYNFLYENEMIATNPCGKIKKLKSESERKSPVFLTDDEVSSIKKRIMERDNGRGNLYVNRDLCILTLGCSTGLRVSALVNIDIDDVDFNNKTIEVIEKGNKKREVYLGDNTIASIKKWMKDRGRLVDKDEKALFVSRNHRRMSVRTVQEMIQKETDHLEKHITPHKMRSTCAMKLYDKTGDIYLTAQQLGHANVQNTMIYAKATEEKRRMAAELLD